MQVVVVDALGRQQVLTQPFYTGATLLRAGLTDYSVELGSIRRDYGRSSSDYGDLVGAVTFRRGLSDRLTTELHAEAQAGGAGAAGIDAALRVGVLGIVTATAAGGGNDAGSGWLGAFGFEHDGPRFNAFARAQYTTEHFAQLGDGTLTERPRQRTFAGLGYDLERFGSLQLVYGLQTRWDAPQTRTVGFSYSMELGELGFLNLFASYNDGADTQADVLLSWTMPLGERRTASSALRQVLSGDDAGEDFEATATLQQSLPVGSGFGYTMTLASTDDYHLGYAYQGRRGVASMEYARRAGEDGWRTGVVGGLAVTQAGAMLSRQLDQGFAMVQVADYAGLEVYLDNQPVGRTDDKGRVLLDRLRAYEENQISLDPASVPMDATLASPMMTVVPAYRSGVLVQFPVTRADGLTLTLVLPDFAPVPAGARITLGESSFPVGMEGRVQLNGVGGRATAIAEWHDGRCTFDLERPANGEPLPDLGTVTCQPLAAGREPR
jgi:outer membrane usher protein